MAESVSAGEAESIALDVKKKMKRQEIEAIDQRLEALKISYVESQRLAGMSEEALAKSDGIKEIIKGAVEYAAQQIDKCFLEDMLNRLVSPDDEEKNLKSFITALFGILEAKGPVLTVNTSITNFKETHGENLSDDVKTEIDKQLAALETTRLLGIAKYEAANDLLHSLSTNPEGVEGSEGAGPKTSLNEAVKRYAFELAVKKYNVYDRSVKIHSSVMHKYAKKQKVRKCATVIDPRPPSAVVYTQAVSEGHTLWSPVWQLMSRDDNNDSVMRATTDYSKVCGLALPRFLGICASNTMHYRDDGESGLSSRAKRRRKAQRRMTIAVAGAITIPYWKIGGDDDDDINPGDFVAFKHWNLNLGIASKNPALFQEFRVTPKGEFMCPIVKYNKGDKNHMPFGVCLGLETTYGRSEMTVLLRKDACENYRRVRFEEIGKEPETGLHDFLSSRDYHDFVRENAEHYEETFKDVTAVDAAKTRYNSATEALAAELEGVESEQETHFKTYFEGGGEGQQAEDQDEEDA